MIVVLIVFLLVASVSCILLQLNLFYSIILFFGIPSLYLTVKSKNRIRPLIYAALIATTIGLLFDYLGIIKHVWYTFHTLFPGRIFGLIPIENPLWSFLYFYTILIAYEYFWGEKGKPLKRGLSLACLLIALVFIIYFSAQALDPYLLVHIPYIYALFGTLFFAIPTALFLSFNKKYFYQFLSVALYIIPLGFVNEVISVRLGHWGYPGGDYIGWIHFFNVSFPVEELLFFIIFSPFAILSFYKFLNEL